MRIVLCAALTFVLACSETKPTRRPDGGWCYWAADIVKTEAQCECVFTCYGCCSMRGECWPLPEGGGRCPAGSVSGVSRY